MNIAEQFTYDTILNQYRKEKEESEKSELLAKIKSELNIPNLIEYYISKASLENNIFRLKATYCKYLIDMPDDILDIIVDYAEYIIAPYSISDEIILINNIINNIKCEEVNKTYNKKRNIRMTFHTFSVYNDITITYSKCNWNNTYITENKIFYDSLKYHYSGMDYNFAIDKLINDLSVYTSKVNHKIISKKIINYIFGYVIPKCINSEVPDKDVFIHYLS